MSGDSTVLDVGRTSQVSTRAHILLPEPIHATTRRKLEERFIPHFLNEASDPVALLRAVGPSVRAIVRGNHAAIDKALMEQLPALEIVSTFGVGYDGIDLDYARAHGIIVTNTPHALTEEVADFTIGLLIMTVRELTRASDYLRSGDWARFGKFLPTRGSLRDRTIGIAGMGRIGGAVARRLDAMGIPVSYFGRHRREDVPYRYFTDLEAMASEVDTLIGTLPGSADTAGLIGSRVLAALGETGVLINVGRGSTVDEAALIKALRSGALHAAGLDVFQNEPNIDPAWFDLDNVVLLPHVGSASQYTHDAMGAAMVDNLTSWFQCGYPLTPVAETPWPKAAES